MKPCAESCIENRGPILTVFRQLLRDRRHLLEIGSGTGQHAVYLAPALPRLQWQTSDRKENLPAICQWLREEGAENLLAPLPLDVLQPQWPLEEASVDVVFSANTAHIMGWEGVQAMFAGVGRVLQPQGLFLLYGPFRYRGRFTTEGNARFDQWLKSRDPQSGIRDIEALQELAALSGMEHYRDFAMPANNRLLVWRRG
ncbi:MAG: class I SAM-dependent methyltransferase [Gammaproteobacteria bacterium]|nr:class I SAM-dependent methyltransferase [Gammaproteobacteria bacterium]MCW8972641.1 class I SAM-dependent methyltransferase [Gammaproteobacteria bacterium]MCW8992034.1 class I SAM-dependent methyltransferase [Gammaproteobacteria bacterium]